MKHFLLGSVAFVALAAADRASAADMPVRAPIYKAAPAAVSIHNWTGFYIGAGWGRGMWNQDFVLYELPGLGPASVETTGGGRGWLGTVTAGFDYQFNSNIVIGVFGDWDWSNIEGTWLNPRSSWQEPRSNSGLGLSVVGWAGWSLQRC